MAIESYDEKYSYTGLSKMYTQLHRWFKFPLKRRSFWDKSKTSSRHFFFVMCLLISISPQAMLDIALLADNAKNMRYCLQVQNYPYLFTSSPATQIVKIFFVAYRGTKDIFLFQHATDLENFSILVSLLSVSFLLQVSYYF